VQKEKLGGAEKECRECRERDSLGSSVLTFLHNLSEGSPQSLISYVNICPGFTQDSNKSTSAFTAGQHQGRVTCRIIVSDYKVLPAE